jgi:hypothetical protein
MLECSHLSARVPHGLIEPFAPSRNVLGCAHAHSFSGWLTIRRRRECGTGCRRRTRPGRVVVDEVDECLVVRQRAGRAFGMGVVAAEGEGSGRQSEHIRVGDGFSSRPLVAAAMLYRPSSRFRRLGSQAAPTSASTTLRSGKRWSMPLTDMSTKPGCAAMAGRFSGEPSGSCRCRCGPSPGSCPGSRPCGSSRARRR